jgi:phosphatidylserine/phosphatidylglycerophosphate/cardiolipin synthase-like enzyme
MSLVQPIPSPRASVRTRRLPALNAAARPGDAALITLIGGVLFGTSDPLSTGRAIATWIADGTALPTEARPDDQLLETARRALVGRPREEIIRWCDAGAAWVLGYRSAPQRPGWDVVISQPRALHLPEGIVRTTGETVVAIVSHAHERIAIASPFIDREAIDVLLPPLLAAAERGVDILVLTQRTTGPSPLERVKDAFAQRGLHARLRVHQAIDPQPWPHMKVVVGDVNEGYIGSANMTGNALLGRNLELGVFLRGDLTPILRVFDASVPVR